MDQDTRQTKVCKDCAVAHPATTEFFYQDKRRGTLHLYCKQCHRARNKKWAGENKEKMRSYAAKYVAANIEKERERNRRAYHADPQKRRAAVRRSYVRNAEKRRAARREYSKTHRKQEAERRAIYAASLPPLLRKERKAITRARSYGVYIEPVSFEAIYQRDGGKCYRCGVALTESQAVFDHVKPMRAGGIHSSLNIKLICYDCNRRKGLSVDRRWINHLKRAAKLQQQLT